MRQRRKKATNQESIRPHCEVTSQTNTINGERRYRAEVPEERRSRRLPDPDFVGMWYTYEDQAREDVDRLNIRNAWVTDTPQNH